MCTRITVIYCTVTEQLLKIPVCSSTIKLFICDRSHENFRVRTILVLGYWVLGNIRRYWVVLLLGDISVHCDTQYDTDQTAVSTVHMITI